MTEVWVVRRVIWPLRGRQAGHAFVTQGLCAWLRWADRTGGEAWPTLRSDVTERWGRDDWGELTSPEERMVSWIWIGGLVPTLGALLAVLPEWWKAA